MIRTQRSNGRADAERPSVTRMTFKRSMIVVALPLVAITVIAIWIGTRRQRRALTADTERLIRAGEAHGSEPAAGDEALAELREAIRLEPRPAPCYYNRALVHAMKKDFEKALKDVDEAVRLSRSAEVFTVKR